MENEILQQILSELKEIKTEQKEFRAELQEVRTELQEVKTEQKEFRTELQEVRTELQKTNQRLDSMAEKQQLDSGSIDLILAHCKDINDTTTELREMIGSVEHVTRVNAYDIAKLRAVK